jgi:uncharacterized Zn-binding protein involved in type VI secretion
MGFPAARSTDFHVCPMVTPAVPPVPHVGGPIIPPNALKVLIGKLPAARMGDTAICTGPPDKIVKGSLGVMIENMPAARMFDITSHGGVIMKGELTVLIGDIMVSPPPIVPPPVIVIKVMVEGQKIITNNASELKKVVQNNPLPPQIADVISQTAVLLESALSGVPFCEKCDQARRELEAMNQQEPQGSIYVTNPD